MKIVLAPDKFKGTISGKAFCEIVENGIKRAYPSAICLKLPLADGGDGMIDILDDQLKANRITVTVNDPLFRPVSASYLWVAATQTACIEMAEASGIKRLEPQEQNCMLTSTFGTGELILDAINRGAKTIILGIGGSATNDCGIGMAAAVGYEFLDENKNSVTPIGENLSRITYIDASPANSKLDGITFQVACDVSNPLYGADGAAFVYARQKGASAEDIIHLDKGLENMAQIFQHQFKIEVQNIAGSGAAGGMGAAALVFLNAQLNSGIDLIKKLVDFDAKIKDADWIITGEGRLDRQTLSGKTIHGVLASAQAQNIPVAAICGAVELSISEQETLGLAYACSTMRHVCTIESALASSTQDLENAAYNFANILKQKHLK